MAQGIQFHVEQHPGPEKIQAERALLDQALAHPAGIGEGRKQQRVAPDKGAGRESCHGTAGRGAFPHQGAKKGRGKLGHGGKGNQADLGQCGGRADHPVIAIGQHQHEGDGQPPDGDQGLSHVMEEFRPFGALAEQQGHDEVVADHDGERDGFNHHHGGGGREAADEGHHGEEPALGADRQGKHEGVAIGACGQHDQPGNGDGDDEDIDSDEVQRKQPGGAADVGGGGIFDHGHMKLTRQKNYGDGGKKGERQPAGAAQTIGQQGIDMRIGGDLGGKFFEATHHGEGDEQPHRDESHKLDDGFNGNGEDHSILVLGGINVAGAEQDGKDAHGERHQHGQPVSALHDRHDVLGEQGVGDHGLQGLRHGLQLNGNIGHHADGRHHRHQGAKGFALAIAG